MDQSWRKRLKELREKAGMKQGDLADKSGVARSQISMLENGTRGFVQKTIDDILEALGCTYHDLFSMPDKQSTAYTPDVQVVVNDLVYILQSGHHIIKEAIISNIDTFKITVTQADEISKLKKDMDALRIEMISLKKADQLQLTSGPDFSHPEHPNGLKIVSGGR
jgi:transcriptional regulator with XRE-family HTH domain